MTEAKTDAQIRQNLKEALARVQEQNAARNSETVLTAPQLYERWQCSHMYIVALLKRDDDFPKPFYMGNRRRWWVSKIEKYERIVAGRGAPPKKAKSLDAA